jgi:predicted nucleic acid-binding protein
VAHRKLGLGHRAREIAREHGLKNGIDAIYIATAERVQTS